MMSGRSYLLSLFNKEASIEGLFDAYRGSVE